MYIDMNIFFSFQLCIARGFVCELCDSKEIIFPWQLIKVSRCDDCGVCFHSRCKIKLSNKKECPRCKRLRARRMSNEFENREEEEEEEEGVVGEEKEERNNEKERRTESTTTSS